MKTTNLAFLYLLSITVDTTIATSTTSHQQHNRVNNNNVVSNNNVLLSNSNKQLRSTTARLLQNKKKKNKPLKKNKPIIDDEDEDTTPPVNPCSVCSTGLTVPSNTTAASNGNTCADLLIDAGKEEEGSEICLNMAGAIPTCCPPIVVEEVVEEVVQEAIVEEPVVEEEPAEEEEEETEEEEPEYTVVLSSPTSTAPSLSPITAVPTPSPVQPCAELNKKRCQKAMDETGRCIFIKGADDSEDSCIDPPPSSSPIVTPTTESPSSSPIEEIVEIEEGDVVLIDNTTLTIEEGHLDMLLAPSDEEQEEEAIVEPLPVVVNTTAEETEDSDFTVEVIPVVVSPPEFPEDTETDDGLTDDNLDSDAAIQALEKAPATAYPTFYPTLSPVIQPALVQNAMEINGGSVNEAAYGVAGKASKPPHGYSSGSSSSYDHSGGYSAGGKAGKPHGGGYYSSSSSSSYDHGGKSGKSGGRHSYSSSSSDSGWGKPYYVSSSNLDVVETQSRSGKAMKGPESTATFLNTQGLTVSSQQLAVEDVAPVEVVTEVVETVSAVVAEVVHTPSLTTEEIMAQSLTAQYNEMLAEQVEEEVETPVFTFNPPDKYVAPPGALSSPAEVAVPEGYMDYVGVAQDVVTEAQEAIQNVVYADKDAKKQAMKDAEAKYKAAIEELKNQLKLQLAALDKAQIATPPTTPNFSEMTISELQEKGMDISKMTIKEASEAVNQKKKQGPERNNKNKGGKSRKLRYRQ